MTSPPGATGVIPSVRGRGKYDGYKIRYLKTVLSREFFVRRKADGWHSTFEVRYRALGNSLPVHLCDFETQKQKKGGL